MIRLIIKWELTECFRDADVPRRESFGPKDADDVHLAEEWSPFQIFLRGNDREFSSSWQSSPYLFHTGKSIFLFQIVWLHIVWLHVICDVQLGFSLVLFREI